MQNQINYTSTLTSIDKDYDVVICGGGSSGIAAAIASSRNGASTLLIDSQSQLGGMCTSGLVSHWLGGRANNGSWVIGGIFKELCERATQEGIATIPDIPDDGKYSPHGWNNGQLAVGIPFDPFRMMVFFEKIIKESNCDILLDTHFIDVIHEGETLKKLIIFNKSGLQAINGRVFIDATGDADIAAKSGCPYCMGRAEDSLSAPVTVQMHVNGVDAAEMAEYININKSPRFLDEINAWSQEGEWPFSVDRFISVKMLEDDTFMINTSRICGVNATDGRSITEGLIAGRHENLQILDVMRRKIPGCRNAKLKAMGTLLGVRESRRIKAARTMSVKDLCNGKEFDDIIGYSAYGWDLPDPEKPSQQPLHNSQLKICNDKTPLPFSIMVPQNISNLLCPGRAVGVERDVLGPVRVMAPCMAMGQAAGTAAAMVTNTQDFGTINCTELKHKLCHQGALL